MTLSFTNNQCSVILKYVREDTMHLYPQTFPNRSAQGVGEKQLYCIQFFNPYQQKSGGFFVLLKTWEEG